MRTHTPDIANYRLAPFFISSLLLHAALLIYIRPPKNDVAAPPPLRVYFSAAQPAGAPTAHRKKTPGKQPSDQVRTGMKPTTASSATQPVLRDDPPKTIDTLLESAKNFARDDARKFEQRALAEEKKDTPAAALAREMQRPQTEIRLANGMLKIITEAGAVCFQPPPAFARDQPGLYGIPMTCP